jgi:hypothetical protein
MATLRDFSAAGPCTTLGEVIAEEYGYWLIQERDGSRRRVMKHNARVKHGLIHAEPCCSCRDHSATQYPEGYMD